jgi:hypothetical protein
MTSHALSPKGKQDSHLATMERRARRTWVSIVVGLLGLQVAGGIAAFTLATGDNSSAIIPGYYQSAVNWDVTRRARQLTRDLGWHLQHEVSPVDAASGDREVLIAIRGPAGESITGSNVSARVFHHAQGANIHQLDLHERLPGIYAGKTTLAKSGVWQIDLRIEGDHGIAAASSEVWVD